MRLTLIHNPAAGDGRPSGADLKKMLAEAGFQVRYESIKKDWKKALQRPADLVVAAGGDATAAKVLKQLAGGKEKTEEMICAEGGINIDSVRRAFAWLQQKGLIAVREEKARSAELTPAGKDCLEKGLPEKRLLNAVRNSGGKLAMKNALAKSGLGKAEFGFA